MVRSFLDAGVLITAARSRDREGERALQIIESPDRVFLTSLFIRLEIVPKAVFYKKRLEQALYEEYFNTAEWFRDTEKIAALAEREAAKEGLAAMDALHLAAAHLSRADEFITTEKPNKSIYRSSLVKVVYLFS